VNLTTIVEEYVAAAMRRAEAEKLDSGTIIAVVPGLGGLVVTGADPHDCAAGLYGRLEEWIIVSIARGFELPVLDGIDPNSKHETLLETYDPNRIASARIDPPNFYASEEEFETALDVLHSENDSRRPA
jgi:hypothetical protein